MFALNNVSSLVQTTPKTRRTSLADLSAIEKDLQALEAEYHQRRKEKLSAASARLDAIAAERANLDAEERSIRALLGEGLPSAAARIPVTRKRRATRTTAAQKKDVIARFIREGHIKHNELLTPSLRAALKDAGFNIHDFRRLNEYLPGGWRSESNGARGLLARTIFYNN